MTSVSTRFPLEPVSELQADGPRLDDELAVAVAVPVLEHARVVAPVADRESAAEYALKCQLNISKRDGHGTILTKLFDHLVEPKLINPTFIIGYPTEVSPLSRRNDENPQITDRFELFIGGREIANAFTDCIRSGRSTGPARQFG